MKGLRVAWFGHAAGCRADGLVTYSAEMVGALVRRGVEVLFVHHRHDGDRTPARHTLALSAARFKTVTIPMPGSRRRIASALEEFGPDIVHVSLSFSLLDAWILALARRTGAGTVVTVHLPYAPVDSVRGRVLRALYWFHGGALRAADSCVTLSDDQRDLLLSLGCEPSRIHVVPNGVDGDAITPGDSDMRRRLASQFVVAYMGRLDPEKRVASLVRAFQRQPWPDDHMLLIAGTGSRRRQIERISRGDSRIHILGAVHDRAACVDILRATDVFVLPSTAEGLSLSLLEAMAAGCAVIATDVAEDGIALGDAGLRIPVQPVEPGLGDALARLHDDASLRAQLGARARARALAQFSMHGRVDALLRLYERLRDVQTAPPQRADTASHLRGAPALAAVAPVAERASVEA